VRPTLASAPYGAPAARHDVGMVVRKGSRPSGPTHRVKPSGQHVHGNAVIGACTALEVEHQPVVQGALPGTAPATKYHAGCQRKPHKCMQASRTP
jgi:hypothetical protein